MLIRCWGARGSISVSGREYLKYGGETTCIEVLSKNGDLIIIDAGTGIRPLGERISTEERRVINLLLTHAHWDHLSGFPFFKPIYEKETELHIFGGMPTQDSLKSIISKTMSVPYFPIEFEDINADIQFYGMGNDNFKIGSVEISTIPLSHPNQGLGFRLEEDGKSFVFLTDNELKYHHETGLDYNDYVEFSRGADLLYHDANFIPSEFESTIGWGHSVYTDVVSLAMKADVKSLGLFHHDPKRMDDEVDAIVKDSKRIIKEEGSSMDCFGVAYGTEIDLK